MRAMVRHNLLNPNAPVARAGASHIFLWVAAVALVGVLIALALSVWYYMKRWGLNYHTRFVIQNFPVQVKLQKRSYQPKTVVSPPQFKIYLAHATPVCWSERWWGLWV